MLMNTVLLKFVLVDGVCTCRGYQEHAHFQMSDSRPQGQEQTLLASMTGGATRRDGLLYACKISGVIRPQYPSVCCDPGVGLGMLLMIYEAGSPTPG